GSLRADVWFVLDGDDSGAWYWTREELSDLLNSARLRLIEGDGDAAAAAAAAGSASSEEAAGTTGGAPAAPSQGDGATAAAAAAVPPVSTSESKEEEKVASTGAAGTADDSTATAAAASTAEVPTASAAGPTTTAAPPCGSREFAALATEGWGSLALDEALVRVANIVAGRRGVPPSHLSEAQLSEAVEAAGPGLGGPALASMSAEKLGARLMLLVELNARLSVALPLLDLSRESRAPLAVTKNDLQRAADVPGVSVGVRSPSGAAVADLRGLLFTQMKMSYWSEVVQETTTFTLPNPDEYERPEEIREIEVNRVKARSMAVEADALNFGDKLRASLLGQLNEAMSDWDDRDLRRSFVHMQDAGQPRAFYVRFKGEGVDDHGGPYRAVFQTAMGEEPSGLLGLLTPCPNGRNRFGPNQDKLLLDPRTPPAAAAATSGGGGPDPARLSLFHHMGRLLGVAGRHRIHVPLALPSLVWKPLVGATLGAGDLEAVDKMLAKGLGDIVAGRLDEDEEREVLEDAMRGAAGQAVGPRRHRPAAAAAARPAMLRQAAAVVALRLTSGSRCLESLYQGLAGVLPVELLGVFTAAEAEALFCGVPEVDVDLLQRATEYEGVRPTDPHVGYFWQALRRMGREDRSSFVNFCSGRSRLPGSAAEFAMNFKLTAPHRDYDDPDEYLPIAQTCFFSLALPKYSSVEVCLEKLRYAIKNADLMDADYLVRSADGWENLR
ncbi:unnamed protein product, partial [Ectocarpus sp. 12 AP-2014]